VRRDDPAGQLVAGMRVANAPEIGHVKPTSDDDLAAAIRTLAPPRRTAAPTPHDLLETGIKVIDLLCPLARGGTLGIFSTQGVGRIVLVEELFHRLGDVPPDDGVAIFCPSRKGDVNAVQDMLTREEGYPGDVVGGAEALWLVSERATDYEYAAARTDLFDAVVYLSIVQAVQGLWPAVDGVVSHSRLLDPAVVGSEHAEVASRARETLARARELMRDCAVFEALAHQAPRLAKRRLDASLPKRLAKLSAEDRRLVERARKLERFLTQRFYVAESFTGKPGSRVPREQTVAATRAILDGAYDDVPEDAFLFVGGIDEVVGAKS
jgi:F0F1-type ATP synthase beta subunit